MIQLRIGHLGAQRSALTSSRQKSGLLGTTTITVTTPMRTHCFIRLSMLAWVWRTLTSCSNETCRS